MEQINGLETPPTTGVENAVRESSGDEPVLWLRGLYHELVGPSTASDVKSPGGASGNNYVVQIDELVVQQGSFLALLGPSGCGKTTLLTILGLARQPWRPEQQLPSVEAFEVYEQIDGNGQRLTHDVVKLWGLGPSSTEIEGLRRAFLGFALQSGELLPNLTVFENVEMPLRLNRVSRALARERVEMLLRQFGTADVDGMPSDKLWSRRKNLPGELSGGEYQRVAIARALAHQPHILFLDEPTNNLDPKTAGMAIASLVRLQREEGLTVVMITHERELAARFATHIVEMNSPRAGLGQIERRWVRGTDDLWRKADSWWRATDNESGRALPSDGAAMLTDRSAIPAARIDKQKWAAQRLSRIPREPSVAARWIRQVSVKVQDVWARRYDPPD